MSAAKKTTPAQKLAGVALSVAAVLDKIAATAPATFDAAQLRANAESLRVAAVRVA